MGLAKEELENKIVMNPKKRHKKICLKK